MSSKSLEINFHDLHGSYFKLASGKMGKNATALDILKTTTTSMSG